MLAKLRRYLVAVIMVCFIGFVTASFKGSSSCGIQVYNGKALWCEKQLLDTSVGNFTVYVAPITDLDARVAIYTTQLLLASDFTTQITTYLDPSSGQIVIVSSTTSYMIDPVPTTISAGFKIIAGSIETLDQFAVVCTNSTTTEYIDSQHWSNGVLVFFTIDDISAMAIKAIVPNSNGFLYVEVISNSNAFFRSFLDSWTLDGTSRFCYAITTENQSSVICKGLKNESEPVVIHSDLENYIYPGLTSDNNGRLYWGELNSTNAFAWRVWSANSDKSDTPTVIDRTANYAIMVDVGNIFGYDSDNQLVYWSEPVSINEERYSSSIYGWDGKTNKVLMYFNTSTQSSVGQVCTYNGKMLLSLITGTTPTSNSTLQLFQVAPSNEALNAALLLSHFVQGGASQVDLNCDAMSSWAVISVVDPSATMVTAIQRDNSTTLPLLFSSDTNITIVDKATVTDGVVAYSLQDLSATTYDLYFRGLPVGSSSPIFVPSTIPSTQSPNIPASVPLAHTSFAHHSVYACMIAQLFYLLLVI